MKFFALLFISGLLIFTSCSKDKSTERKINGEYEMDKYSINGFEATGFFHSLFPQWKINLKKAGGFTETFGNITVNGTWNVTDKGEKLTLVQNNGETRVYTIVDHDKKSLEVTQVDADGNTNRFLLKAL